MVFFLGSKFFLASFLEIHLVEEKGASICVVDLKLECVKNNINIECEMHKKEGMKK